MKRQVADMDTLTPASEDLLYIVDDPSGTPTEKKTTIGDLQDHLDPLFLYHASSADAFDDEFETDTTGSYTVVRGGGTGTIAFTHGSHGLSLSGTNSSADGTALVKAGTIADTEWIETCISAFNENVDFLIAGVCMTDGIGTTANVVATNLTIQNSSTDPIRLGRYGGTLDALSGATVNINDMDYTGLPIRLRMRRATNDFYAELSLDGVTWDGMGLSAITESHTWLHMGLFASTWGGSPGYGCHFEYVRKR